jgi:hypothetical protein
MDTSVAAQLGQVELIFSIHEQSTLVRTTNNCLDELAGAAGELSEPHTAACDGVRACQRMRNQEFNKHALTCARGLCMYEHVFMTATVRS